MLVIRGSIRLHSYKKTLQGYPSLSYTSPLASKDSTAEDLLSRVRTTTSHFFAIFVIVCWCPTNRIARTYPDRETSKILNGVLATFGQGLCRQ